MCLVVFQVGQMWGTHVVCFEIENKTLNIFEGIVSCCFRMSFPNLPGRIWGISGQVWGPTGQIWGVFWDKFGVYGTDMGS